MKSHTAMTGRSQNYLTAWPHLGPGSLWLIFSLNHLLVGSRNLQHHRKPFFALTQLLHRPDVPRARWLVPCWSETARETRCQVIVMQQTHFAISFSAAAGDPCQVVQRVLFGEATWRIERQSCFFLSWTRLSGITQGKWLFLTLFLPFSYFLL